MGSDKHRSPKALSRKERRQRLFRRDRPIVREVIYEDLAWLWTAARRNGSDLTAEEFTELYEPWLVSFEKMAMLEDSNDEFQAGTGPVCLVVAHFDGWALQPHANWFPWVTKRNILRCSVAYLSLMAYSRKIGVVRIHADKQTSDYFEALSRYLPITRCGAIPNGRPTGEDIVFAMKGKKSGHSSQGAVRGWRDQARARSSSENTASTADS